MTKRYLNLIFAAIMVVSIGFAGCKGVSKNNGLPAITLTISSTTPSIPVEPFVLETKQPTQKLSITISPTSRKIATPKESTTLPGTNIPTLSPDNSKELMRSIYRDNGGCFFPCWSGITPGITTFTEAVEYVRSFSELAGVVSQYDYRFYLPDLPEDNVRKDMMVVVNGKGSHYLTSIFFESPLAYFPLATILTYYGLPDEVRISAEGSYMALSEYGTYWIVLYYKEKGIMVEYEGTTEKGENLTICFSPERLRNYTSILLVDPNLEYSFIEAGKFLFLKTRPESRIDTDYKPLSEVSDLDAKSFYDRYRLEENRDECFLVPDRKD